MTNEQSITLLRRNKQEQIEAFKAVGMVDVDENTRASEFAKRIKWAGGLLDLCLACVRIADGSYHYFTHSEWENLNDANKALYVKRGLRVRAEGHSFVMAALDCQFNSAATMKWGTTTAVPGMSSKTCNAAFMDFDGEGNTAAIVTAATSAASGNSQTTAPFRPFQTAPVLSEPSLSEPFSFSWIFLGETIWYV